MVFSGRPSPACHACRTRRLKCDLNRTGCSQCKRKGLECSGYRDVSALRIRDDTSRVVLKGEKRQKIHADAEAARLAKVAADSPKSASTLSICSWESESDVTQEDDESTLDYFVLEMPMHDVALAFLLGNYIVATPFESYLPNFYAQDTVTDDACASTITATAYAALARHHRDTKLLRASQRKYAQALSRLKSSVADRELAVKDRTLVAVLVMGIYEAIVHQAGQSPTDWTTHTFAAFELLKLRDAQECKSSTLMAQLSSHSMRNVTTSCIQQGVDIPWDCVAFYEQIRPPVRPRSPSDVLEPITHTIVNLKARSLIAPDFNLILEAAEMAEEVHALSKILAHDPEFAVTVVPSVKSTAKPNETAYPGFVHSYTSLSAAKTWNAIRLLLFFLYNLVSEGASGEMGIDFTLEDLLYTKQGLEEKLAELDSFAMNQMSTLGTEVLASVPTFINGDGLNGVFVPAARSLIWPLSLVVRCSWSPPTMIEHATHFLNKLAADLNMGSFINAARIRGSRDDWLHLCHSA